MTRSTPSKAQRTEPLISVIVPVYNVDKYLRQSLDSVVHQSYQNLEILIVDDGSTDDSPTICDEYARQDDRVTVSHIANRGLSGARNHALDRATGEYITFLDSDDWLEPNAYRTLLDEALLTDADIVTCRFYQEYVNRTFPSEGPESGRIIEGDEILRTYLLGEGISHDSWNKLYKASMFDSMRYPEGRAYEDIATTYILLRQASRLAYVPDCLVHYRNRRNSLSNSHAMTHLVDYWLAYRERFATLGAVSEEYRRLALAECMGAISRMWRWYAGFSREEKKGAKIWLDEMQDFVEAHRHEIVGDRSYSRHVRLACLYTRARNPVVFKALYYATKLYRSSNGDIPFEQ